MLVLLTICNNSCLSASPDIVITGYQDGLFTSRTETNIVGQCFSNTDHEHGVIFGDLSSRGGIVFDFAALCLGNSEI